jgi:hypothetical protein
LLGIELSDPVLIARTQKVVRISIGLVLVLIVRTVLLLIIGESVGPTLLSLAFNLSIPAFGYLGARDGSTMLMCMFVALMALNAGNAIAILVIIAHAAVTAPLVRSPTGDLVPFKLTTSLWVQSILIFAWALMALVGAYHAQKLYSHLAQGDFAKRSEDPEAGLPQIEMTNEHESFNVPVGKPSNQVLQERGIDEELSSPTRKRVTEPVRHGSPRE